MSEARAGHHQRRNNTVSSPKRSAFARSLAYFLPLLFLFLVAGCVGFNDPDGWASPEVAEDTLYLTVDNGELTAVDPESFEVRWEFPASDQEVCGGGTPRERDLRGIYASPVIDSGRVYLGAWDGNVYALDAENGECLWDFETNDPIIGGLALGNDRLFAASTDGNLYVIDPETGDELDRTHAGDVWSRPAFTDGVLYVASVDGDLRAYDPDTLEELWDEPFHLQAGLLTDPAVLNGSIIVGGLGQRLYAVDAETGEEQWAFEGAGNWFWGTPLISSGAIFATNLDSRVYAIDAESGQGIWDYETEWPIRPGAVLADGVLIVVDDKGFVYGLDPLSGDLIWNSPTEIEKDVLADPYVMPDGSVMIVSKDGSVFTVSPEDGRLTTVRLGR